MDPDIIAVITAKSLNWLGHVQRREEDTRLKEALTEMPKRKIPIGIPRLRWHDHVSKDLSHVEGRVQMAEDAGVRGRDFTKRSID